MALKLCKLTHNTLSLNHAKFYWNWSSFWPLIGPRPQLMTPLFVVHEYSSL